jgi:hypothetical protein
MDKWRKCEKVKKQGKKIENVHYSAACNHVA